MASPRPEAPLSVVSETYFPPQRSPDTFPYLIRAARQQDLLALADLLARGFHTSDGMMGWLYPILKMGIQEDLRIRLRAKSPRYICLVAVPHDSGQGSGPATTRLLLKQMANGHDHSPLLNHPIVGTVELGIRTSPFWTPISQPYLYISNLAVGAEYRRQGIALQLLMACERIALNWGFRDLYLHVLENNQSARRLYQKAGYRYYQAEFNPLSCLMGRPKQLLLHKPLQPPPVLRG